MSATTSAEIKEELQCILAAMYQGVEEDDDSIAIMMDMSFMESMVVGIKEMQGSHGQKWQALKEQRKSANKVDQ